MKVYFRDLVHDLDMWVGLFSCEKTTKEELGSKIANKLGIPTKNVEWWCKELGGELFVFMCPYRTEIFGEEFALIHSSKESAERDYKSRSNDI